MATDRPSKPLNLQLEKALESKFRQLCKDTGRQPQPILRTIVEGLCKVDDADRFNALITRIIALLGNPDSGASGKPKVKLG